MQSRAGGLGMCLEEACMIYCTSAGLRLDHRPSYYEKKSFNWES